MADPVGITQSYPTPDGFAPGGGDPGVIRILDGHKPWAGGIDGANVHHRGDGVGDPMGFPVDELNDD